MDWLMFSKISKKIKGFSIAEITIAIGIIAVGLIGILSLAPVILRSQNYSVNYLTASMLAQEGLELTRNIRDTNWLDGSSWDDKLSIDDNYAIDGVDLANIYFASADLADETSRLNIDSTGAGRYCAGLNPACSGTASSFKRVVELTNNDDSITVNCIVRWIDRGKENNYIASTELYDWR